MKTQHGKGGLIERIIFKYSWTQIREGLNPNKPYISVEVQTKKYGGENQYQIVGQKVVLRKHEQMSIAKIRVNGSNMGTWSMRCGSEKKHSDLKTKLQRYCTSEKQTLIFETNLARWIRERMEIMLEWISEIAKISDCWGNPMKECTQKCEYRGLGEDKKQKQGKRHKKRWPSDRWQKREKTRNSNMWKENDYSDFCRDYQRQNFDSEREGRKERENWEVRVQERDVQNMW